MSHTHVAPFRGRRGMVEESCVRGRVGKPSPRGLVCAGAECVIRAACKQLGVAVFVVVASVSGVRADAANAFLPASANPLSTSLHNARGGAPKERLVRIARGELASVRDEVASWGAARLLLNVDAELELGVAVERTSPTRWGYSLSGRIDDPTVGFMTLVVHDEAVAGAIWTPDASYEIVHMGGGVHAVREVVQDVRQCGGPVAVSGAQPFVWPANTPASDENTVVDVLVVWTPRREEETAVETLRAVIDLGIAYTNDAFERSGAFVSLNLVGAERIDYDESGSIAQAFARTDLARLADPSDGHMDAVHGRRDALGADLVSLAVARGPGLTSARGGAQVLGAFSVANGNPHVVAHEFGHNFGLQHERHERFSWLNSHRHGYATLRALCISTIMAYGGVCQRAGRHGGVYVAPFFSSPVLFHPANGVRLGVSRFSDRRGADGPADAVLHLNRVRHAIANFRPRR